MIYNLLVASIPILGTVLILSLAAMIMVLCEDVTND